MSSIGISLISLIITLCVINTFKFIYDNLRVAVLFCMRIKARIVGKKRKKAYAKKYKKQSMILERLATEGPSQDS